MKDKIIRNYTQSLPQNEQASAFSQISSYADTLLKRGITNEKTAAELAVRIANKGLNRKKVKAETYDKINYMCRCYMDRIARFRLDYDFIPDVDALKTALICLYEHSPIFHSYFKDNRIAPYWKVCDYVIEDSLTVENTEDIEKSAYEFIIQGIDIKDNTQMKVGLFINGNKCALCFRWNHMIMDGGGFKQFLCDLFSAYNTYKCEGRTPLSFAVGLRALEEIYKDMPRDKQKAAQKKFANMTSKEKKHLPFSEKSKEDENILIVKEISSDIFMKAAKKGKEIGATVNDVLSACYIEAAYKTIGCQNESMTLSCAVDLRRYLENPCSIGYTNHTTFMPCTIAEKGETIIDTLKEVAKSTKKSKEDEFLGLYGLPLLNFAFLKMIYFQAESAVKLFYNNALLAVSNVGAVDTSAYSMEGNKPVWGMVGGGAKKKNCAATTILTIDGTMVASMCIQGNEKDRIMVEAFFNLMEESMKELAES